MKSRRSHRDEDDHRDNTPSHGRGRHADQPQEIPPRGWFDIAMRVKKQIAKDNLGLVAAGVAFYAFLALFPSLIAMFSIYGMVSDPQQVTEQVESFSNILPQESRVFLHEQMKQLAEQSDDALSWGTALGLLGAIWGATKGVRALMMGLNIAYDEKEGRGFIKKTLWSLMLTSGILLGLVVALAGIIGVPAVLAAVGAGSIWETLIRIIRWPILGGLALIILAVLYRWGPNRKEPRWSWVSAGAIVATVIWMVASALFSIFVHNFGNYTNTYGSVTAIVVLMLWLWISSFIILLGAELNAEMEHQTAKDTTTSGGKPMGQRGAYVADNLGESQGKGT